MPLVFASLSPAESWSDNSSTFPSAFARPWSPVAATQSVHCGEVRPFLSLLYSAGQSGKCGPHCCLVTLRGPDGVYPSLFVFPCLDSGARQGSLAITRSLKESGALQPMGPPELTPHLQRVLEMVLTLSLAGPKRQR